MMEKYLLLTKLEIHQNLTQLGLVCQRQIRNINLTKIIMKKSDIFWIGFALIIFFATAFITPLTVAWICP